MKKKNNISNFLLKQVCLFILICLHLNCTNNESMAQPQSAVPSAEKSIKLALILDTSNSMDGLIEQAKSQLWIIVNELAKAECDNDKPDLYIALYEYGNDNLPGSEGYIRMVTPLTTDLDQVSKDLFSLTTRGGQEFCGHVIHTSLNELSWSNSSDDYQVMFIAGNEPFTQGTVPYTESCAEAKRKGVVVNTIYCGDFKEGIRTSWKKGAVLTGGEYFSIDQNSKTVYIETPYDDRIVNLNQQLNNTYVYYGSSGKQKKELQREQDLNSAQYGQSNTVNRIVSKSSHIYKNCQWDLVDASSDKDFDINKLDISYLPTEMQKMSKEERLIYIEKKKTDRENIKNQINDLNLKREKYITEQRKSNDQDKMLDQVIISSIIKQAKHKNFIIN